MVGVGKLDRIKNKDKKLEIVLVRTGRAKNMRFKKNRFRKRLGK